MKIFHCLNPYINIAKSLKVLNNRIIFECRQAFTMTNNMASLGLWRMSYLQQMVPLAMQWVKLVPKCVASTWWCMPTYLPNDMCWHLKLYCRDPKHRLIHNLTGHLSFTWTWQYTSHNSLRETYPHRPVPPLGQPP